MGLLEWGDSYKRADALRLTSSEDGGKQMNGVVATPFPSRNIREELFEIGEDYDLEIMAEDSQLAHTSSLYSVYTPSQQEIPCARILPGIGEDDDEGIYFPSYDDIESDRSEPDQPTREFHEITKSPEPCDPIDRSEDDSAIRVEPSRHVDYFSHDWAEQDIWASWKHLVSKRGAYNDSARLENTAWRSWAQMRLKLSTVAPESVKWMKEHDVTWLYGPLTPGSFSFEDCEMPNIKRRRLSRAEVTRHNRKPILKKRSPSEILLQRSISTSTLLKEGVVTKVGKETAESSFPFNSPGLSRTSTGTTFSRSTCGLETPDGWKKVQFHELVEQCVALATTGDDDHQHNNRSDSDEDMMVVQSAKKRSSRVRLRSMDTPMESAISTTIKKLPHVPLKDAEGMSNALEEDSDGISDLESNSTSSHSTPSLILLDNDSDDDYDINGQPPGRFQWRRDSVQHIKEKLSDFKIQQDVATKETKSPHIPRLERRDALMEVQHAKDIHASTALSNESSEVSFESRLSTAQPSLSFETPVYSARDYSFSSDSGMTEGESEGSGASSRSTSLSSEVSDKTHLSRLALENSQRNTLDKLFQSHLEPNKSKDTKGLGIMATDSFQTFPTPEEHEYPKMLSTTFHQPFFRYTSDSRSQSPSSNVSPLTRDNDSSLWSLPKEIKGRDGRCIREVDLYDYDELDEAAAWSEVF